MKYFFLNEKQMKQLQVSYKNTNDKNDKTFDMLVDVNTNQKITPENIKNIENNIK